MSEYVRVKASMAVWVTILRFMGDLPEPNFASGVSDIKVWQQCLALCAEFMYVLSVNG